MKEDRDSGVTQAAPALARVVMTEQEVSLDIHNSEPGQVIYILLRQARPCSASRRGVYTAYTSSGHSPRLSLSEHGTPETQFNIVLSSPCKCSSHRAELDVFAADQFLARLLAAEARVPG